MNWHKFAFNKTFSRSRGVLCCDFSLFLSVFVDMFLANINILINADLYLDKFTLQWQTKTSFGLAKYTSLFFFRGCFHTPSNTVCCFPLVARRNYICKPSLWLGRARISGLQIAKSRPYFCCQMKNIWLVKFYRYTSFHLHTWTATLCYAKVGNTDNCWRKFHVYFKNTV